MCNRAQVANQRCVDHPPEWQDSDGDSCHEYARNRYCEDGGHGSNWVDGDTFAAYADAFGVSAEHACCNCGGGDRLGQTLNEA